MMVIRPDSVPDNLEEQKIYIFTDNYLDNQQYEEQFVLMEIFSVRADCFFIPFFQ